MSWRTVLGTQGHSVHICGMNVYQNRLQISEIPFLAICQVLFLRPLSLTWFLCQTGQMGLREAGAEAEALCICRHLKEWGEGPFLALRPPLGASVICPLICASPTAPRGGLAQEISSMISICLWEFGRKGTWWGRRTTPALTIRSSVNCSPAS